MPNRRTRSSLLFAVVTAVVVGYAAPLQVRLVENGVLDQRLKAGGVSQSERQHEIAQLSILRVKVR